MAIGPHCQTCPSIHALSRVHGTLWRSISARTLSQQAASPFCCNRSAPLSRSLWNGFKYCLLGKSLELTRHLIFWICVSKWSQLILSQLPISVWLHRHFGVNYIDEGVDISTGFHPEWQHNRNPQGTLLRPAMAGGTWFPKKNLPLALNVLRPQWTIEGLAPDTIGKHRAIPSASLRCHGGKYNETERQQPKCLYVPLTTGWGFKS